MCVKGKDKSFKVHESKINDKVSITVVGGGYPDLKKWMPWIEWNGGWSKCIPSTTQMYVPPQKVKETKNILKNNGFVEE
eukprot:gene8329-153_t